MRQRRRGFQLARIFGISISVGVSWFVVLFLYIIWFVPQFESVLGGSRANAYAVTVVTVLCLFLALVLHELGHAVIARRNGLQVEGIELWALGGITRTVGSVRSPGAQFRIAAAGPLVTLAVIVLTGAGAALVAPHQGVFDFVVGGQGTGAVGVSLKVIAIMNALILALNLVPAFPLDGGQIAQAIVWWKTGDRNLATRLTGRIGQALALAIGAGGLYLLSRSHEEGLWLLLIAMFVYQGAGAAVAQGSLGQRMQQLTVADVMDREPITIPAEATLLDAREEYLLPHHVPWLAVVDSARRFLGVVRMERVEAELSAGRPALSVLDALEEDMPVGIGVSQPLESLLRSEAMGRLGGMVAIDADGTLRGVVTLAAVRQALRPAS